ncbi:Squalene monooxygenase SE1 [Camellia lanceoleosa]|uniref:Squalene monooxygenase SE1 n=1 Tax=Camellia lanceoleosa TaxID=1840588 RepID=A0ACC0HI77_9ERIC|nr:Squalene monooxygenase SE1 [Camellia lanceoleosa]
MGWTTSSCNRKRFDKAYVIVGELSSDGGYLKLIELGLEDCVQEIDAQRVLGYALFKDGRNTRLSYPLEKFHSDVAGRSFHNGRFIQRMREKAATLPKYTFLPIVAYFVYLIGYLIDFELC